MLLGRGSKIPLSQMSYIFFLSSLGVSRRAKPAGEGSRELLPDKGEREELLLVQTQIQEQQRSDSLIQENMGVCIAAVDLVEKETVQE